MIIMKIKPPKVFLDSANPEETKKAKGLLGHLDGQTTNPTLVAKNPDVQSFINQGKKFSETELLAKYKEIIQEISKEIAGPVSVEVYADWDTKSSLLIKQAEEMDRWGKNVYIKFPTLPEGLKAAHEFVKNGGKVNMTLVFDQEQAAAVYSATRISTSPVLISPFVGRWEDRGYNGLELLKNIIKMYKNFEKLTNKKNHIQILAASLRTLRHLYTAIWKGVDIVTISLPLIKEWVDEEKWIPDKNYRYNTLGLKPMIYRDIKYRENFEQYKITREDSFLLEEGIEKFVQDWKKIIK
jgi:transaldolase